MSIPDTRHSLLVRIRNPHDAAAWDEFSGIYRQVVYRMAVAHGLQNADADDLTQHVLLIVSQAIEQFDFTSQRAKFRTWLRTIARNAIINSLTRGKSIRSVQSKDTELLLHSLASDNHDSQAMVLEYRRQVFLAVAEEIRSEFQPSTWSAFWRTAVEARPIEDTAKELGISLGSVYAARCRIVQRSVLQSESSLAVDTCESEVDCLSRLGFSLDPSDDPEMLGRVGAYEISGVVGAGGMGIVLKGWDRSLDRFVAIKFLQPTFSHHSASRQRFAREAKAAAGVVHDNVIAIYGVDSHHGLPYLVMPYIKGESLQRRIERAAPLGLEEMIEITLQTARGLQAAHDQGLVHRDIKPANILLPQSVSRVVITDFGLARTIDDATLTQSGSLTGTPNYMSPEVIRGEICDHRTDLFSLGSTMYAMACGHPPFRADSPYAILRRITDDTHRPLSAHRTNLPRWFCAIVDQLLEKKPQDRFPSAGALADHLEQCLAFVRQPDSRSEPTVHLSHSQRRQRMLIVSRVCVFATLLTLVAGWAWWTRKPVDDRSTAWEAATSPVPSPSVGDESQWNAIDEDLKRIEQQVVNLLQEIDDDDENESASIR
jgi:eukaryotic-like serine/threonine-protein kinase